MESVVTTYKIYTEFITPFIYVDHKLIGELIDKLTPKMFTLVKQQNIY